MAKSCCLKGWHNRQDREQDWRYFSIPRVANIKGKEMEELKGGEKNGWRTVSRGPHVHAWRGEVHAWRA